MKRNFTILIMLTAISINAQTHNNGALSTGTKTSNGVNTAPTGYTWSELQSVNGINNTTLGSGGIYNNAGSTNFLLADDFKVPAGEKWTISSIDVFLYQTAFTGTIPPIDVLRMQVFNNLPENGTAVLGNPTTNVYKASESSNAMMYRIGYNSSGTTRKIWKTRAAVTGDLLPGTYWIQYQVHATNDSSIFFPGVTTVGALDQSSYNARQNNGTSWTELADGDSGAKIDLPFIINYTVTSLGTTEVRQFDNRVSVYPNPTVEKFRLALPEESRSGKTKIELFDASGKFVKSFGLQEEYSVSELKSGVYMIKINDAHNTKVTKLIKN